MWIGSKDVMRPDDQNSYAAFQCVAIYHLPQRWQRSPISFCVSLSSNSSTSTLRANGFFFLQSNFSTNPELMPTHRFQCTFCWEPGLWTPNPLRPVDPDISIIESPETAYRSPLSIISPRHRLLAPGRSQQSIHTRHFRR